MDYGYVHVLDYTGDWTIQLQNALIIFSTERLEKYVTYPGNWFLAMLWKVLNM